MRLSNKQLEGENQVSGEPICVLNVNRRRGQITGGIYSIAVLLSGGQGAQRVVEFRNQIHCGRV